MNYLNLDGSRVTNDGLVHIRDMDQLTKLLLGETGVSDVGLSGLTSHRELVSLRLPGTSVSAKAAEKLKQSLPRLQNLQLR